MQLTNFFFRGLKAFSLVAIAAVLGGSPVAYSQAGAGKGRREGQGGAGGAGTGAGVSQRVSRSHVCMTRSREPVEDF